MEQPIPPQYFLSHLLRPALQLFQPQCEVLTVMTPSWYFILAILAYFIVCADAIGCFKCTSINHKNPECEDTFNNTGKFYEEDCWASRRGRTGFFPGTQCIKMIAEDESINYTVVVRNCVVDDGGTNTETEIGRQSHCGWMKVIKYNGRRMRGCILSCDTDACNHGNMYTSVDFTIVTMALICLFVILMQRNCVTDVK